MKVLFAVFLSGMAGLFSVARSQDWTIVPSPNPGSYANGLRGVAAVDSADAWAVGTWQNSSSSLTSMVIRWNGSSWSEFPLPNTDGIGPNFDISDVDMLAADDVWITGYVTIPPSLYRVVALHWNGSQWDRVEGIPLLPMTEYPYSPRAAIPSDIEVFSSDNVWISGWASGWGDAQATTIALLLQWNGSEWIEHIPAQVSNRTHQIYAVEVIASNDVWAVGYWRNISELYKALLYHWNGSSWTHVSNPAEPIGQTFLNDVVAFGPNDIWAAGERPDGSLFLHYDGSTWSLAASPVNVNLPINAIDGVNSNDVWAASRWSPYLFHYNGTSWSVLDTVEITGVSDIRPGAGLTFSADGDGWLAGNYYVGGVSQTLTLHRSSLVSAPNAIADLVVSDTAEHLVLHWSASAGATAYDIYRLPEADTVPDPIYLVGSVNLTSFSEPILELPLRSFYVVIARN